MVFSNGATNVAAGTQGIAVDLLDPEDSTVGGKPIVVFWHVFGCIYITHVGFEDLRLRQFDEEIQIDEEI